MRLRELIPLLEIFDQAYDFKRNSPEHGQYHTYNFKTNNGKEYETNINHYKNDGDKDKTHAHIDFAQVSKGFAYGKTGDQGNESHKVFSTVHHILKQHIQNNPNIKHYSFDAGKTSYTGPSRTKLYSHMISKMTHKHEKEDNYSYDTYSFHKDDIK